jgi:hypothetical protein
VDVKTVKGGSLPDIQNTDFTIQFLHNRSDVHVPGSGPAMTAHGSLDPINKILHLNLDGHLHVFLSNAVYAMVNEHGT